MKERIREAKTNSGGKSGIKFMKSLTGKIYSQVRWQVWWQVRNQVGDQVVNQVWNQVENRVWNQVRNQVYEKSNRAASRTLNI